MLLLAVDRGAGHGPGFLFPLLLIGLAAFLFVKLRHHHADGDGEARMAPRHPRAGMARRSDATGPMQTLADRFARGEIGHEEYIYRRAVLNGDQFIPPTPAGSARGFPADEPLFSPTPADDVAAAPDPSDPDPGDSGTA